MITLKGRLVMYISKDLVQWIVAKITDEKFSIHHQRKIIKYSQLPLMQKGAECVMKIIKTYKLNSYV